MKAIYLNLDPYLAAFAAWLKGGKVGDAPHFNPLPLAVTIPLGEEAALYCPAKNSDRGYPDVNTVEIDGEAVEFLAGPGTFDTWPDGTLAKDVVPSLSKLAPDAKYGVVPISGDSVSVGVFLYDSDGYETVFSFTVLVRRETAQGPVDLVDFAPPAAAIAAGTDLKGTKFNGNEIVAAAGTGALSAPAAGG